MYVGGMYRWAILGLVCHAEQVRDDHLRNMRASVHSPRNPTVNTPHVRRQRRIINHPEDLEEEDVEWVVPVRLTRGDIRDGSHSVIISVYVSIVLAVVLLLIYTVILARY